MNNTSPPHVQTIRKPGLTVMGMLSYLGEKQLKTEVKITGIRQHTADSIGVIASIHQPDSLNPQDRSVSLQCLNTSHISSQGNKFGPVYVSVVCLCLSVLSQLNHFMYENKISWLWNVSGPMIQHNCHGISISTHPSLVILRSFLNSKKTVNIEMWQLCWTIGPLFSLRFPMASAKAQPMWGFGNLNHTLYLKPIY